METDSPPSPPTFPETLSDLYVACKNNRLDDVTRLLRSASLTDINRREPHGSTALHAAAFYGHEQIVKLLLDKGASRTILNNYNYTPSQEAKTPEIRRLFERESSAKRFSGFSDEIEWNVIDSSAARSVSEYKETQRNWFNDVCAENNISYLKDIERYIRKKFADIEKIDQICHLIDQAIEEKNMLLILKAYTLETDFYHQLNVELATINTITFEEHNAESQDEYFRYWHGPGGYAALIAHHQAFKQYEFVGTSYRGMLIRKSDIATYKVRSIVINKAFLSTSTDRKVAKTFMKSSARTNQDTQDAGMAFATICTYNIRNRGSGFNLTTISEYREEQEVLIMPRTAFRVTSIKEKRSWARQMTILIELDEWNPERTFLSMKEQESINEHNQNIQKMQVEIETLTLKGYNAGGAYDHAIGDRISYLKAQIHSTILKRNQEIMKVYSPFVKKR